MPTVDMPVSQSSSGGKEGFGTGIPTPLLLIGVGGGIGLIVFLMRKQGATSGTGADKGTLLPNTAIMLGSLQQGILQLQGDVTMGNADLSSQLTGVGENLGTQIDLQSGQIAQSFADLNTFLTGNFQTIAGSQTSLAQGIATLGTQNADLASSLSTVLANLKTYGDISTANQAAVTSDLISIFNGLNIIQANQNALHNQVGQIGDQISDTWGPFMEITRGVHDIENRLGLPPT